MFWTLVRNEFHICARLNRTKFIITLMIGICAFYFVVVTLSHMQTSGLAPMLGVISPRYLASLLGSSFVALFCVGVLVLAFDMQSRDESSRIYEVIASKPVSSVQFFLGRIFGVCFVMAIPLVTIVVLAVVYGFISEIFAIPFGEPIEFWSVVSLLLLDVIPNFIFFGLLVVLLASFIRPRFVALLLAVCCLYGVLWINSRLPLLVATPLQTVTGSVIFPSDLTPTLLTAEIVLNRAALVLMGMGFLYWASALHLRNTSSGAMQPMKGVYAFSAGVFLIAAMIGTHMFEQQQIAGWKRVHDAHFEPASFPDVHNIEGTVEIYPGRSVSLALTMSLSISNNDSGEDVLFSFNPGYRIVDLSVNGEIIKDHKFRRGLLKIPRRHFVGDIVELALQATGRPDSQFAYLDSVERLSKIFGPEVRQLRYLGTENYIFRPEFVALMPGIKWYPVSGTATNEDNWNERPKDFFTVNLQVSVPRKWTVAGPAQRKLEPEEKRTTYRFQTENPIPQLALVASRFEQATQSIDGIEFEVLYSRAHRRNFKVLTPLSEILRETVEESLENIKHAGLNYPYSVFSLVEVPVSLRSYGGGSKIDTVLGMPGILMMPETTLPTLHLDSFHNADDFEWAQEDNWTNDEWIKSKRWHLQRYFGIELYAGNHLSQSYRSIFSDQTWATGPQAQMLNLILEQVIQLTLLEYEISFDFDLALDQDVLDLTYVEPTKIFNVFMRRFDIDPTDRVHDLRGASMRKLTTDEVWDAVDSLLLADYGLKSVVDSVEQRAVKLRALAVSRVLIDVLGTEKLNSIFVTLLDRYRGLNFSYEDFIAEVHSHDPNLESQIRDMLHSYNLPGFNISYVSSRRLDSDDEGNSRFQVSFILENGEAVSGYCLLFPVNHPAQLQIRGFGHTEPIFVGKNQSLEVVIESANVPIIDIVIEPYLSLNRTTLRQHVTTMSDWAQAAQEYGQYQGPPEVTSIRETSAEQDDGDTMIVVDDLDKGFSVVDESGRLNFEPFTHLARRLAGKSVNEQIRGLPAYQFEGRVVPSDTWERKSDITAYGKYWKTLTLNRGGSGKAFAKFATSLPEIGTWRLEYFVPTGNFERVRSFLGTRSREHRGQRKGVANIDVHTGSTKIKESFDISAVVSGWYLIGEYDIDNADVEVWISNPGQYSVVFADAIRWSPAEVSDQNVHQKSQMDVDDP